MANDFPPMPNSTPQTPDRAAVWRALLAGYWLALVVATHLPRYVQGLPGDRTDKLVHVAAYAGLAWLLATAWQNSTGTLNWRHLRAAWVAVVLYAVADELTQPWIGRVCSSGDWLADAVGAALGLVVFAAWRRTTE